MKINDTLFIIPARGGSKGLPRKNILPLSGKPMICYTIDAARGVTNEENICISTDNAEIKQIVEDYGLKVPFIRPVELASDTAGTREVVLHAIDFYKNNLNKIYSKVCILQPTSPLRNDQHIRDAYALWDDNLDMVVSVKESKANPYFNLFEENAQGFLQKSKEGNFIRRQDAPIVWEYNGAIYVINTSSIQKNTIIHFQNIKKYKMNEQNSIDVDTTLDYIVLKNLFEK